MLENLKSKLKNKLKEFILEDETNSPIENKNNQLEEKIQNKTEINKKKENYQKMIKNNIKKGKDYEKFVGSYFEEKGYIIKFNGIEKGKKDNSIDLIAIKDNEIIFIQCKNWKENGKYKINEKIIKSFIGDTYTFIQNNSNYKNYTIKRLFVISGKILDKSAYYYIKENQNIIKYLLLKYPK